MCSSQAVQSVELGAVGIGFTANATKLLFIIEANFAYKLASKLGAFEREAQLVVVDSRVVFC